MFDQSARQTVDQPLEEFIIFGRDDEVWRALRQPLGSGTYRTPDDPTARGDLGARLTLMRQRVRGEQFSPLPSGV